MNTPNQPKRASNTCVTCRARKVRCDGHREVCNNCLRLGFTCSYDDSIPNQAAAGPGASSDGSAMTPESLSIQAAAAHPPRRRVRQACQSCHSRKAKCSGTMPKCDRCRVHALDCVYRPSKRSRLSATPGAGHAHHGDSHMMDSGASGLSGAGRDGYLSDHSRSISDDHEANGVRNIPPPDEALTMRTFELFFRHIHHIPLFSYLHQASLMQRYHSGLMDRSLLFALIGITSMLTDLGPGVKTYGNKCIDIAETLILRDLEQPTVLKIQTLVLIIKHRIFSRHFSSAFMLTGLASRFAAALRLNYENSQLCFLAQESRRRLMWALYIIDIGMAGGDADFTLWASRPETILIKLPCNERNFEYDLPEATESLIPPPSLPDGGLPPLSDNVGFLALHIRIQWVRSRILAFTKGLARQEPSKGELASLPRKCKELEVELDAFEARLPLSFRWSESNVKLRTYSPRLCVYLMTHIWWRQCHCDLYRFALAGRKDSLSESAIDMLDPAFVRHCQRQCFEHARAMVDMFSLVLQLEKGVPVSDLDLPVCVYQCANTLYYSLATNAVGLGLTQANVAEMAEICLGVVKQSAPGAAAVAIGEGLEILMTHGWRRPQTPSSVTSQASSTPANPDSVAVDPMLQRDALQGADVPEPMTNPGIPQPQESDFDGSNTHGHSTPKQAQTQTQIQVQAQVQAQVQPVQQVAVLQREEEQVETAQAGMMTDTAHGNAFEGALDGSNFGYAGLEPFGMDSSGWYTGDWMDPDPLGTMG